MNNYFQEETNPVKKYYNWMLSGRFAILKIFWTGLWLTFLLFLKFAEGGLVIFFGFLIREIALIVIDPEYDGHSVWEKI